MKKNCPLKAMAERYVKQLLVDPMVAASHQRKGNALAAMGRKKGTGFK